MNPTVAKLKLNTIAQEVIALLSSDPNANNRVTLEIAADFPNGFNDSIQTLRQRKCDQHVLQGKGLGVTIPSQCENIVLQKAASAE